MLPDRPRLQVLVGGRDLSERCDSLTFSAVDRGGFEICSLGLPSVDRPVKGSQIWLRAGLETAWMGRVAEIADQSQHGVATKTTGGEGYRALLKDSPMQMVYVDRSLANWQGPSVQRQINVVATNNAQAAQVGPDSTTGAPSLVQSITGDWSIAPGLPLVEGWYDAGPGNLIGSIYYAWKKNANVLATDTNWLWQILSTGNDVGGVALNATGNLRAAGPGTGTLTATASERYGVAQFQYQTAAGGTPNVQYALYWTCLAVYGSHGLTTRGTSDFTNAPGLWPSDIARHALSQVKGIQAGVIVDSSGYVAPHVVYRAPTDPDQIVDDMAKLMGWSWGVWEPRTAFDSSPRLDFRPPPTDATCVVTKADCDELSITARLGDLYDTAIVTFTDAAGKAGEATVTLPNTVLYDAGIPTRTLLLDIGTASLAAATTFGLMALALSQVSARGAGQATLPTYVRLAGGGSKPSMLLRPGIDRLRIVDLVDGGPLLDLGSARRDTFHINRIETTVQKGGDTQTRVELDTGVNLLEALQARLAISAGVVGSGASG